MCVCVRLWMSVWGALSACWLPGNRSNWGGLSRSAVIRAWTLGSAYQLPLILCICLCFSIPNKLFFFLLAFSLPLLRLRITSHQRAAVVAFFPPISAFIVLSPRCQYFPCSCFISSFHLLSPAPLASLSSGYLLARSSHLSAAPSSFFFFFICHESMAGNPYPVTQLVPQPRRR